MGESPSLVKDGKITWCTSEKCVCQLWQFLKNLESQASQSWRLAADCKSQVSSHPETCREWFQNGFNLLEKASPVNKPDSHSVVLDKTRSVPKETTPKDMRASSEEESTNLLVVAERSGRPKTGKPTGRHNVFTHFHQDPNCEACRLMKTTRAPCGNRRKREETVLIIHKNLIMLQRRIIEFTMKRTNLFCSIDMETCCRDILIVFGFTATLRRLTLLL